jgi:Leucine-rich repeat (LRR) protein
MQPRTPSSNFLNRVTNPNFKTPPTTTKSSNNVVHTHSVNVQANKSIVQKVKSARLTSIINLSNMNLDVLPREIFDENIKYDDINWWEMVEIKKLDASNNKLTSESFQKESQVYNFNLMPSLNYVKFSFNLFTSLPDTIFSLVNLKYLDFSNNKIYFLNSYIKNLKCLVEINLSNNALTSIPEEIGFLTELEVVNFSFNKINLIPNIIGNLKKIKKLDLSENLITSIPLEINYLSLLEELILFKNKIVSDSKNLINLEGLVNLKYLDLHNNFFVEFMGLPNSEKLDTLIMGYNRLEKIQNLNSAPNLSVLDLNNNKIENFPEEILGLKELKTLNLMNNSLNDIPPRLCFLKKLVRINLEGNPLKKLNSKVRSSNAEHLKAYLKTRLNEDDIKNILKNSDNYMDVEVDVDLASGLTGQGKSFFGNNFSGGKNKENNNYILSYLHNGSLKMNNMNIEEIPVEDIQKGVASLKNTFSYNVNNFENKNKESSALNSIDFSVNRIKNLENFCNNIPNFIPDLKEIKLSTNFIKFFPSAFLSLFNLKTIDLKNNQLSSFLDIEDGTMMNFPNYNNNFQNQNIGILPNLEYLDLSINKFKEIPSILKHLHNLTVFLISNNHITDASPLYQTEYSQLDTLDLGTNKISILKEKLYRNFPNLKNLNVENNEIKIIPTDVCLLQQLNKLNVSGNPIKMLRSNLISGGTKMILDYLRKMHKFDSEDFKFEKKYSAFGNRITQSKSTNSNLMNEEVYTEPKFIPKQKSELDQVNEEILEVESELNSNPNMPMFKKTDLKKRLTALIRLRANLIK